MVKKERKEMQKGAETQDVAVGVARVAVVLPEELMGIGQVSYEHHSNCNERYFHLHRICGYGGEVGLQWRYVEVVMKRKIKHQSKMY